MIEKETDCERCAFLCQHKINLTAEEYDILNSNRVEVTFEAGEMLVKQGTFADNIMVLQKGLLKKVVQSNNQKNIIIKINKPGDYIGLQTLGVEGAYPYSVVSLKQSKVCIVRKDIVKKVFESNAIFQNYLLKYFAEDTVNNYNKLSLIGTKQMHGRLAEILIYLSRKEFQDEKIFHYLTRKDYAELAGMSLESMTKIFNEFKNDKLIEIDGKTILLKELDLLNKLIDYS